MELAYLSAAEAQTRLIEAEIYTAEEVPSEAVLTPILSLIEAQLDGWLGWRAAPTDYEDTLEMSSSGQVLLPHYPILSIENLQAFFSGSTTPHSIDPACLAPTWKGNRALNLRKWAHYSYFVVQYRAGLDPLPSAFSLTLFQVLQEALRRTGTSGDLSFLNDPIQHVSKVKLPGGLEKGLYPPVAPPKGSAAPVQTNNADRLFAPLSLYRRNLTI